ncbi:MAG: HAD family phosphatase [Magnetococcales bacterium]|nr:HAD family phosphatase [Magnetococcales bacterium]
MPPDRTKGIIFDMDGVLWLSGPIHENAFTRVMAENRLPQVDYAHLAGRRTDQVFRQLLREHGGAASEEDVLRLTRLKQLYAMELLRRNPPLDPQCPGVIRALANRMQVALASSASREGVATFLQASGLEKVFSVVLSGDDVQNAKPDPEIYLLALQKMGLAANQVFVVEDSAHGVDAAIQAGIGVIVRNSGYSWGDQRSPWIHARINTLDELDNHV